MNYTTKNASVIIFPFIKIEAHALYSAMLSFSAKRPCHSNANTKSLLFHIPFIQNAGKKKFKNNWDVPIFLYGICIQQMSILHDEAFSGFHRFGMHLYDQVHFHPSPVLKHIRSIHFRIFTCNHSFMQIYTYSYMV